MQEQGQQKTGALMAPPNLGMIGAAYETASSAVAAAAAMAVQARYVVAYRKPRNFDQVRIDLLKECNRPAFAAVARYHKPIGKGVEGPSIRFAEAAARCMGNILVESPTIYDDREKRIVRVVATDLETNMTYQKDITVTKTVERRKIPDGQTVVSTRVGSKGDTLYIIEADDDAILNKENALVSKAMRTVLLRLIPGDLIDEAMWSIADTVTRKDAEDPGASRKLMVDSFASVGVQPTDLVAYIGHSLDSLVPAELARLRSVYQAIKDEETTWLEVMGNVPAAPEANDAKTQAQRTTEILEQKRAAASPKGPQPGEPPHDPKTGEVKPPATTPPPTAAKTGGTKRGTAPTGEPTRGTFPTDAEIAAEQESKRRAAKAALEETLADEMREPGAEG